MGFFKKKKDTKKDTTTSDKKSDFTVLGYISKGGKTVPLAILDKDRQNMFLGGEIKSGKTTVLKSMIIQDIKKGNGVLVLDPHMNLVTDILGMVPKKYHDKIIYISMDSAALFDGWTVRINPVECKRDEDRPFVVQSYMHLTESFHGRYWGPRVAVVIRNLVNTLVYLDNYKHTDLLKILTDEKFRQYVLTKVPLKHVKEFWENIYPQKMAAEATGTAYNKLDEIVTTPNIAMILDTVHSSIDISKIIDDGSIVLVNLQSGTSEELAKFMGSIMLHLFSVEGRNKQKQGLNNIRPFSIYVDEAHEFAPQILRELLNRVRKWGAKMTIASQSITKFDKTLGSEMSSLCTTIGLFRTNYDTAKVFEDRMSLDAKQLVNLNTHQFALYVNANPPIHAVAGTKHMPSSDEKVWLSIAEKSVKKYGQKVDVTKYIPVTGQSSGPQLSPLEFFILNILHKEHRDMTKDEILEHVERKFNITPRDVNSALIDSLCSTYRYVDMHKIQEDDGDGNLHLRFSVSKLAITTVYSQAAAGRRAGGDLHLSKLFELEEMYFKNHNYCKLDLGEIGEDMADLTVYSFLPEDSEFRVGKDSDDGRKYDVSGDIKYAHYDSKNWSANILAIEVEIAPSKHPPQVIINFEKNWKKGYFVAFIVFSEKERDVIYDTLDKKDIAREDYSVTIDYTLINIEKNKQTVSNARESSYITPDEEKIILSMQGHIGCTSEYIIDFVKDYFTAQNTLALLYSLEQKGIIIKSSATKTKTTETLNGEGTRKTSSQKEIWLKTDKFPDSMTVPSKEDHRVDDTFVRVDGDIKETDKPVYANTDAQALLMLVEDGTGDNTENIISELKRRGYGIRTNKKSGKKTLFKIKK